MRENRLSGSEGGGELRALSLPLSGLFLSFDPRDRVPECGVRFVPPFLQRVKYPVETHFIEELVLHHILLRSGDDRYNIICIGVEIFISDAAPEENPCVPNRCRARFQQEGREFSADDRIVPELSV